MEDIGRQAPLRVRRFTFVDLCFLRGPELDLELVPQGVQPALRLAKDQTEAVNTSGR